MMKLIFLMDSTQVSTPNPPTFHNNLN